MIRKMMPRRLEDQATTLMVSSDGSAASGRFMPDYTRLHCLRLTFLQTIEVAGESVRCPGLSSRRCDDGDVRHPRDGFTVGSKRIDQLDVFMTRDRPESSCGAIRASGERQIGAVHVAV
jgi:hypothetical protein